MTLFELLGIFRNYFQFHPLQAPSGVQWTTRTTQEDVSRVHDSRPFNQGDLQAPIHRGAPISENIFIVIAHCLRY
jgi:hypothetical protein